MTHLPDSVRQFADELKEKVLEHKAAYSVEIFPSSEKLDDNSSRTSISAKMGRHMCDCFLRYIDEAISAYMKSEG